MSNQQSGNGVLLGALVGGAIGAIAALLLAPKSGAQLREDLAETCQTIGQKTKDIASNLSQSTRKLASAIKEETTGLADHVKQSNHHALEAISAAKEEMEDEVHLPGR